VKTLIQYMEEKKAEMQKSVVFTRERMNDYIQKCEQRETLELELSYENNEETKKKLDDLSKEAHLVGSSAYQRNTTRWQNLIKRFEKIIYELNSRYKSLESENVQLFNDLECRSTVQVVSGDGILDEMEPPFKVRQILGYNDPRIACLIAGCPDDSVALCASITRAGLDVTEFEFSVCSGHFDSSMKKNHEHIYSSLSDITQICSMCKKGISGSVCTLDDRKFHNDCSIKFKAGILKELFRDADV
jgi:hypothetical protein